MTRDDSKSITPISYNHLNLPIKVTFGTNGNIAYVYNGLGEKISKLVTRNGTTTTIDYLDGFQYEDATLEFFPTAEGYVRATKVSGANVFNYVYQYKDHLGNIRMNYAIDPDTNQLKILEENHYYAFGLKHANYFSLNLEFREDNGAVALKAIGDSSLPLLFPLPYQYKYNGKEWQDELGLNFYDYGARNYDPAIGRWINIDPLAETSRRFSPYVYALNNPVLFIYPDGMATSPASIPPKHLKSRAATRMQQMNMMRGQRPRQIIMKP